MMKFARMVILACSTAIAIPSLALAAEQTTAKPAPVKPAAGEQAKDWDCDCDGMGHGWGHGSDRTPMTKEQWDAKIDAAYKDADSKKDGKVTLEEFRSHMQREQERRRTERQAEMFKRMDANNDGVLTAEEFKSSAARMHQRMEGRGGHMGRHMDGKGPHMGMNPAAQPAPATTPAPAK